MLSVCVRLALSSPPVPPPPPPLTLAQRSPWRLSPLLAVNTNGSITQDEEAGEVIQLQGDQRQSAREWLLVQEVVAANEGDRIVIHGF